MRILHIAPVNSNGDLPTFLNHQINSLNELTESHLFLFKGSDLTIRNPIESLKTVVRFWRVVRNSEADVIHAHWGSILGFLTTITAPKRVPIVLTLRGSDVNTVNSENRISNFLRQSLSRYAVSHATFCIFVSDQLYQASQKNLTNFAIISDGTSLDIFKPQPKVSARKLLDWPEENTYVLFYCGGRPVDKNLSLAVESVEILKEKIRNVVFIVIESNLSQKQLANMFAAADVFLFTSLSEGSPNVVREAIACGCPVVSVDVGDVEKWVLKSDAGQVCKYNAKSLAFAMTKVIEEGQVANSEIAFDFSLQKSASRIFDVYLKVRNNNGL